MKTLVILAAAGCGLALFECWASYLPQEEAGLLEFCRFSPALDCVRSVQQQGRDLSLVGIPALPALFGCLLFTLLLLLWGETTWASVGAFPAAGLSLYQMLDHLMVARCTSADALLLVACTIGCCVIAVKRGGLRSGLRRGALPAAAALVFAVLAGGCVGAAGEASVAQTDLARERSAAPAPVIWPAFAEEMPRQGAPFLGDPFAPSEVLLFADLAEEQSLQALREAVALEPEFGKRVRIVVYPTDARGYAAEAAGGGAAWLRSVAAGVAGPPIPAMGTDAVIARMERKRKQLEITVFPTLIWKDGRESGKIDFRPVLAGS